MIANTDHDEMDGKFSLEKSFQYQLQCLTLPACSYIVGYTVYVQM